MDFKNLDISLEDLKIKAKNQLIYLFETEEIEAIEHVEKTLSNLKKAGYLLAVASSSEREIIKRHLIELDFLKYFDLYNRFHLLLVFLINLSNVVK